MEYTKITGKENLKRILMGLLPHIYSLGTLVIGIFYAFRMLTLVSMLLSHSALIAWSWNFYNMVAVIIYGVILIALLMVSQHLYAKEIKARWLPKSFVIITVVQAFVFLATEVWIGAF